MFRDKKTANWDSNPPIYSSMSIKYKADRIYGEKEKRNKRKKGTRSKLYKPPDEQIFVTYQSDGQDEFFSAHTLLFPEKRLVSCQKRNQ